MNFHGIQLHFQQQHASGLQPQQPSSQALQPQAIGNQAVLNNQAGALGGQAPALSRPSSGGPALGTHPANLAHPQGALTRPSSQTSALNSPALNRPSSQPSSLNGQAAPLNCPSTQSSTLNGQTQPLSRPSSQSSGLNNQPPALNRSNAFQPTAGSHAQYSQSLHGQNLVSAQPGQDQTTQDGFAKFAANVAANPRMAAVLNGMLWAQGSAGVQPIAPLSMGQQLSAGGLSGATHGLSTQAALGLQLRQDQALVGQPMHRALSDQAELQSRNSASTSTTNSTVSQAIVMPPAAEETKEFEPETDNSAPKGEPGESRDNGKLKAEPDFDPLQRKRKRKKKSKVENRQRDAANGNQAGKTNSFAAVLAGPSRASSTDGSEDSVESTDGFLPARKRRSRGRETNECSLLAFQAKEHDKELLKLLQGATLHSDMQPPQGTKAPGHQRKRDGFWDDNEKGKESESIDTTEKGRFIELAEPISQAQWTALQKLISEGIHEGAARYIGVGTDYVKLNVSYWKQHGKIRGRTSGPGRGNHDSRRRKEKNPSEKAGAG